ncbi:hypothetical protein ACROAH_15425 [Shewanella oncorhynchi]|uniref:hypothetical protein n=1 Tax=Shewanella oncorhynchi TaxID=2726434 RepID=UPI003D7A68DE
MHIVNAIRICSNSPKKRVWFGTSFTPYPRSVSYALMATVCFCTVSVIANLYNSLTPWAGIVVMGLFALVALGFKKKVYMSYLYESDCLIEIELWGIRLWSKEYDLVNDELKIENIMNAYRVVLSGKSIVHTNSRGLAEQVHWQLAKLIKGCHS